MCLIVCSVSVYIFIYLLLQIWADDYLGGATVDLKAIGHAPTDVLLRLERTDAKTGELRIRGELVRACVCVCVCVLLGGCGKYACRPCLFVFDILFTNLVFSFSQGICVCNFVSLSCNCFV